jgi:OOP family OmpA-OmpF porin
MTAESMDSTERSSTGSLFLRRYRRAEPGEAVPFFPTGFLPIAALLLLLLFAWTSLARQTVELSARQVAESAIEELDAGWARAAVSGQQVTLTGSPPSPGAADLLAERIRTARVATWLGPARPVTRVRTDFSSAVPLSDEPQPASAPDASLPAPPEVSDLPGFEFKLREGQMLLNGVVPDTATHRRIGEAARALISAPRIRQITNALRITNTPAPDGYEEALLRGLTLLARCDAGTARFAEAKFDFSCEAPAETSETIAAEASAPLAFGEARTIELLTRDEIDSCDDGLARVLRGTRIEFESASAAILPESEPLLDQAAEAAGACPGTLRIEGHTDSTGGAEINRALSLRRAEAVREALISRDVPPGRLVAEGYGSARPVSDNQTAEGRARNRRIEIRIVRPGE